MPHNYRPDWPIFLFFARECDRTLWIMGIWCPIRFQCEMNFCLNLCGSECDIIEGTAGWMSLAQAQINLSHFRLSCSPAKDKLLSTLERARDDNWKALKEGSLWFLFELETPPGEKNNRKKKLSFDGRHFLCMKLSSETFWFISTLQTKSKRWPAYDFPVWRKTTLRGKARCGWKWSFLFWGLGGGLVG